MSRNSAESWVERQSQQQSIFNQSCVLSDI